MQNDVIKKTDVKGTISSLCNLNIFCTILVVYLSNTGYFWFISCFEGDGPREGKQLQWEGEGEAPIIPPSPWGIPVSRPHVEHEHDEAKKKMKKEKKSGVSPWTFRPRT